MPPAPPKTCTTSTTTAKTTSKPAAKLLAELLPVPAGATRPSSAPKPRAFTLKSFVADLYSQEKSHETSFLSGLCFKTAVNSQWHTASGTIVSIYLIQFAIPAEASSYSLGLAQADISAVSAQARHATVHGVSDGTIIQDPKLDHFGNTLTRLIGDVGSVAILFHVFVPATLGSESSMESLLRSQASKITTFSG